MHGLPSFSVGRTLGTVTGVYSLPVVAGVAAFDSHIILIMWPFVKGLYFARSLSFPSPPILAKAFKACQVTCLIPFSFLSEKPNKQALICCESYQTQSALSIIFVRWVTWRFRFIFTPQPFRAATRQRYLGNRLPSIMVRILSIFHRLVNLFCSLVHRVFSGQLNPNASHNQSLD